MDVAVLKLAKVPEGAHVLSLAREKPGVGSMAWTLGYPHEILTPDWGTANGVHGTKDLPPDLRAQLRAADDTQWIQTSAVLTNGSSGGPLLNSAGEVIGMSTFFIGRQQGFALYIPQARASYLEATRAKPLTLPIPPSEEEPTLAWLSKQVAPLRREYEHEIAILHANPGQVPEQILQQQLAINKRYRDQFLALARQDPASWSSTQALLLACDLSRDDTDAARESLADVAELVTKHHLESRKAFEFVIPLIGRTDDTSRDLFRRLIARSPHTNAKAFAAYALAHSQINWLATQGVMEVRQLKAARSECEDLITELQGPYAEVNLAGYPLKQVAIGLRDSLANTPIGLPAKAIVGKDVEGKPLKLADHVGKVVMVDFFGDYCPPCRSMYDFESKLVERMHDRPFALLGVSGDDPKRLAAITKAGTIHWPTIADGPAGPIAADWRVTAVPWIFLIDKNGIVRRQFIGVPDEKRLSDAIETLMGEHEAAK
jgi:peroxiredoxin